MERKTILASLIAIKQRLGDKRYCVLFSGETARFKPLRSHLQIFVQRINRGGN